MPHSKQIKTVEMAMKPIADMKVPESLRASVDKQNQILLDLALSMVNAGLSEQQVRSTIETACASYRDELITTVLAIRAQNG